MKQSGATGLGLVMLSSPFTLAIRGDPLGYVRDAKTTIDRKKRSLEAELVLKLFDIKV